MLTLFLVSVRGDVTHPVTKEMSMEPTAQTEYQLLLYCGTVGVGTSVVKWPCRPWWRTLRAGAAGVCDVRFSCRAGCQACTGPRLAAVL